MRRFLVGLLLAAAPLASAGAQQRTGVAREWSASLGAQNGWESNVLFQQPGDPGDMVSSVSAAVSGLLQNARTQAAVTTRGDIMRYRTLDRLNRTTYAFDASLRRAITPRVAGSLSGTLATSLASDLGPTTVGQQLLPLSLSRSRIASAGVEYRVSPNLTGAAGGSYSNVTFESPLLADGSTTSGRASIARRYAEGSTYGLSYEMASIRTRDESPTVQSLALTWAPTVSGNALRVEAGASAVDNGGGDPVRYAATGGAAITRAFRRASAELLYRRSATQAFGLGRVFTTDQVALGYDRASSQRTGLRVALDQAWSRATGGDRVRATSTGAEAEWRRTFSSGLQVGTALFARRRTQDISVQNSGVRFSFHYIKSGR